MKNLLFKLRLLEYEINILGLNEIDLTGVNLRLQDLKSEIGRHDFNYFDLDIGAKSDLLKEMRIKVFERSKFEEYLKIFSNCETEKSERVYEIFSFVEQNYQNCKAYTIGENVIELVNLIYSDDYVWLKACIYFKLYNLYSKIN